MIFTTGRLLAFAAIAIPLCGYAAYAIMIVRGEDSANRVSWALWAIGPAAAASAARGSGVPLHSWAVTAAFGIGPLLVLLATFSRPYPWAPGRFDVACGATGLVALGAWYGVHRAALAVWLSIAADAIAAAPTVRDFWREQPGRRASVTYLAAAAGAGLALWGQRQHWTLAGCAFQVYVAAVCTVIAAEVLLPRRRQPLMAQLLTEYGRAARM